ncbi:MAG: DUF1549 and DUF1553 domain-containing protein [Gemmataceae bacterium]|nr:DUF1549 and DUF1553 domain-containing protein [Gemmataceae bacterium]
MTFRPLAALVSIFVFAPIVRADTPVVDAPVAEIIVDPAHVRLSGPNSVYTLLVHGKTAAGRLVDLTADARFQVQDPAIAQVTSAGIVRGRRDGTTQVHVEVKGRKRTIAVDVKDAARPRAFHFENDIIPLFNRYGCNSAGCHGNAEGQNGFKLSVFGFDPAADHAALTKEARGRRVVPAAPEASLLLTKASGAMAHGGGVRIRTGTQDYETLRGWIAAGTPMGAKDAPRVTGIKVEPHERLLDMKALQQLRVIARISDNREIDVTQHARFQVNREGLASVSEDGLVSVGTMPGEVAVMASYLGAVDTFRALIPRPEKIAQYPPLVEHNFIDGHVHTKLRKLNMLPSAPADDATYLRRVYLDVIGTLPTADEARRFLTDKDPAKRTRLVNELLDRPEYADYWALKWADLLRVDRQALGHKRAYGFYRWIRDNLAGNKPFDQFARELLLAEGPLDESGPASFYKVVKKPGDAASALSQIFLGVRIACAECHHHPFDRWSQADYFGMQAFFTPVNVKAAPRGELLEAAGDPQTTHPRTGEKIHAHVLGAAMPAASPAGDRRVALAAWFTSPENPWFAKNLANRLWAHFLGRGLVEPVDDVRDTNPPSNPELLDALAKHVAATKFDVKQLIRAITASAAYQRSTKPNPTNADDEINAARALFRRIDAEVLLDMVSQTTGIAERFNGAPPGTRAIQLWDSKTPHYFLKLFGRPQRVTACECERNHEPGVSQVLHLLNSPEIHAKLSHDRGRIAKLVQMHTDDAALVDEMYLTFLSRFPTADEKATAVKHLTRGSSQRRAAAEDLAWSLLNSLEFVFNH